MSYADDCYCDYDEPEWFSEAKVKAARKPHKCAECGAVIAAGAPYEYVCGKWNGYINSFHTCELCVDLRNWAKISVPCFCWTFGNLHEDVREMVANARHDVPGLFFEYGRRIVKIKRRAGRRRRKTATGDKKNRSPATDS